MSNLSAVREFVPLGYSHLHEFQSLLFAFIVWIHVLTVLGNLAFIILPCLDSHLHLTTYSFLCNSSMESPPHLSTRKTTSLAECLT